MFRGTSLGIAPSSEGREEETKSEVQESVNESKSVSPVEISMAPIPGGRSQSRIPSASKRKKDQVGGRRGFRRGFHRAKKQKKKKKTYDAELRVARAQGTIESAIGPLDYGKDRAAEGRNLRLTLFPSLKVGRNWGKPKRRNAWSHGESKTNNDHQRSESTSFFKTFILIERKGRVQRA